MRSMLAAICRPGLIALVFCFLPTAVLPLAGQREADHWYFGNRWGVDFSQTPPVAITENVMRTSEGCASYSDPQTGRLQLYTNGFEVWNRNHDLIPSSAAFLPVNRSLWPRTVSTTQPALVLPHPANPDLLYIFNPGNLTNSRPTDPNALRMFFEFSYLLVDMSKNGGSGEIVEARALSPSVTMTEKLTGTGFCTGNSRGYWVVTQVLLSDAFYAYKVNAGGVVATPVISRVGHVDAGAQAGIGQMKLSPDGTMLATVNFGDELRRVHLFRFDVRTGRVSDPLTINLPDAQGLYGLSFSPDNSRLYVGELRNGFHQLTVDPYTLPSVNASVVKLPATGSGFHGQMQIGPDRRIYIAEAGAASLGVINFPNRAGLACEIGRHEVEVDQSVPTLRSINIGLPNFMDHIFDDGAGGCGAPRADFTIAEVCEGDCVQPRDRSRNTPTDWHWFFQGGVPAEWEGPAPPPICYERAGTYQVRLELRNAAGSSSATRSVLVHRRPAVDAGEDIRICRGASVKLQARGTGIIRWHTAASLSALDIPDPVATPEETSEYVVTLTNERGCENRDTVVVIVDSLKLEVSSTQTICAGESVQLKASGAQRYEWSPSDGLNDPQSASPIARPGRSTVYRVRGFNAEGCSSSATVRVELVPQPVAELSPDTSICSGESIQLRASGGERYEWQPSDGLSDPGSATPIATPWRSTRYVVTVYSGQNCSSSASIMLAVNEPPRLQLSEDQEICSGASVRLRAEGGERYEWHPAEGLDDPTSPTPLAGPISTTLYTVTAFGPGDCATSAAVEVRVRDVAIGGVASAEERICAGEEIQLQAFGGERYRWSPAEGLSASDIADPIASPASSRRYTVEIVNEGCSGEYLVDIIVEPRPELIVSSNARICTGESTVLRAAGGERFEWSPARGLSDPQSATPVASPDETTLYTVRSWNAAGCVSSATLRVLVRPWQTMRLSLPEVEVTPGEEILLPLELAVPDSHLPVHVERLHFDLSYDARLMALRGVDGAELLDRRPNGEFETLTLERRDFVVREPNSVAFALRVMGLIALSSETELLIESAALDFAPGACLEAEWRNGSFAIHDFCLGYGVSFAPRLQLRVQPNPAPDDVRIEVQAAREGSIRLQLLDAFGRTVLRQSLAAVVGQRQEYYLATASLPSGYYYLIAENGTQMQAERLLLLR